MNISFSKYHGTGNDFILIDDREMKFDSENNKMIAHLCQRRFGIGADGLILIRNNHEYDFEMLYFNSDGRVGSMCGNGGRCAVKFAQSLGMINTETTFKAYDGAHKAKIKDDLIELQMLDLDKIEIKGKDIIMDTGSPHYVIFNDDVNGLDIVPEALKIRNSRPYIKQGINVNFVQMNKPDDIQVRTYERGVEQETYSCGTGVVASSIASALANKAFGDHFINVSTIGGKLAVRFNLNENKLVTYVWLIGPAKSVFDGIFSSDYFK